MLPAGFKVNGVTVGTIPPQVERIAAFLNKVPFGELLSSVELAARLRCSRNGDTFSHSALLEYKERIGSKLFWGSRKTIADLLAKLTEDTNEES